MTLESMRNMESRTKFFSNQALFRDWLRNNHAERSVLWVGYYKKASGIPSMTWPESVDQALCYGWIDGLRKSMDDVRYKIRFTPRKPTSNWSDVNIKRVAELKKKRLMRAAGLTAYEKRKERNSRAYAYEKAAIEFGRTLEAEFRRNKSAWEYFESSTLSYKKQATGWVMSAKKEETRNRRLMSLIDHSRAGEKIPQVDWKKKT